MDATERNSIKQIHLLFLGIFSLTLSGCGTIPLPSAPTVHSFTPYTGSKTLGVTRVHDLRGSDRAGNVALYGLNLERKAFEDFVTNHLLHTLNKEMKINVVRVGSEKENDNIDLLLKGTVEQLDVYSLDSILDPVDTKFRFSILLLGPSGTEVYTSAYEGQAKKWVGLSVNDKVYGQLVDEAVKSVFQQIASDQELLKLLK